MAGPRWWRVPVDTFIVHALVTLLLVLLVHTPQRNFISFVVLLAKEGGGVVALTLSATLKGPDREMALRVHYGLGFAMWGVFLIWEVIRLFTQSACVYISEVTYSIAHHEPSCLHGMAHLARLPSVVGFCAGVVLAIEFAADCKWCLDSINSPAVKPLNASVDEEVFAFSKTRDMTINM